MPETLTGPTVEVVRLVDRPDLTGAFWDLTDLWPDFVLADPIADLYFSRLDEVADHVLLAVDEHGRVLARALGVPFRMGADVGRSDLPANGWDGVIRWAWLDALAGRVPTHLSALEITVAPDARRTGLATRMLEALRDSARDAGLQGYVARTRADGLPADPWVRLHVRAGGRVVGVCPTSMIVPGTLAQWRDWTGRALDTDGPTVVDRALVPVHVDLAHDYAVYVEPNVWVEHTL